MCFLLLTLCGCSTKGRTAEKPSISVSEISAEDSVAAEPEPPTAPLHEATPYYNTYTVNLDINPDTRQVLGIEKIKYKNTTETDLKELHLNVYIQSFIRDAISKPFPAEFEEDVYRYGNSYATFSIHALSVNNKTANFELKGTQLIIKLPDSLGAGEETEISLQFECYIPKIAHRIGSNDDAMWFGGLIPTMATYNGGWREDHYYAVGEPLYADISNYDVTVSAPKGYTIVSPGTQKTSEQDHKIITTISAKMIREFAFTVSNKYIKDSINTKDNITINLYHISKRGRSVDALLENAKKNLEFFVGHVGSYPYTELNIVECELFSPGDAEYPQMVLVDKNHLSNLVNFSQISYDFGYQWFNCVLGVDQAKDGWLNKALTEFIQSYILYTPEDLNTFMKNEYDELSNYFVDSDMPVLSSPLSDYSTWQEYNNTVNRRGRLMMYELYKDLGQTQFSTILKKYYALYSFKNVTAKDFFSLCEEVSGKNLNRFFTSWSDSVSLPPLD